MKTIEQIRAGLTNDEFYLEYMPTISLDDNRCIGAEALVRWCHNGEEISPLEFIPIVENTAVSGLVTFWVIEEVGRELRAWLKQHEGVHVGINIPPEIIGRGGIEYAANNAGLLDVADRLILEITERGFPDKQAIETLPFIRGKTKIAIDDFGTGDANIVHYSQMDADVIKLDKYFIDQIIEGQPLPKIIKGLTAFALAMDLELIAEGVESAYQVDVLKSLGVHMAQGWYFSRPLSAEAFMQFHEGG